jgi:hypothetical protein
LIATNSTSASTFYPVLVDNVGANSNVWASQTGLKFSPSTGLLIANLVSSTGQIVSGGNLYYNGNVLVTRTLTVGTRTTAATIPLSSGGNAIVLTRASGNVNVPTNT